MCTNLQALRGQLDAVIAEMRQLPARLLTQPATDTAGNRCNQMRELVAAALPNLADQLPPPVKTSPAAAPGSGVSKASNLDIRNNLQELRAVVDDSLTSQGISDVLSMNE